MNIYWKISLLLLTILAISSCDKKTNQGEEQEDKIVQETQVNQVVERKPWKPIPRLKDPENDLEAKIFEYQDSLHRAEYEERINLDAMKSAVDVMREHGLKYPKHKKSASYLLKAADYAQGMRNFDQALDILNLIIKNHKGSYERVDALYYKGYIYDRQMKDYPEAIKYYEQFLKEYPNNDLAPQVEAHLTRVRALQEKKTQ